MKYASFKILALISTIVVFSPAKADYQNSSDSYLDKAKVLSVVPIYKTISVSTPQQQCREVRVRNSAYGHANNGYKSATPIVLGGIVGALVGNRFGHGKGKTVGAIAGGVLGGAVARDVQYRYRTRNSVNADHALQTRTTCSTINAYHDEERLDGYKVKYRYNGRVYHTRTDTDPGRRMRVRVSVAPEEH